MNKLEATGFLLIIAAITWTAVDWPIVGLPFALLAVGCFTKGAIDDKGRNSRRDV